MREGDWVALWPGVKFWPMDVRVGDFRIDSIARGLSMSPRFNGHMTDFYSVAEHCVHVSYLVPPLFAREGLLHDATEFALGDLVRPIKEHPRLSNYTELERGMERVLALQYDMSYDNGWPLEVKNADNRMLFAEKARLLPFSPPWSWGVEAAPVRIQCWDWKTAERKFIDRAIELGLE